MHGFASVLHLSGNVLLKRHPGCSKNDGELFTQSTSVFPSQRDCKDFSREYGSQLKPNNKRLVTGSQSVEAVTRRTGTVPVHIERKLT